MRREIRRLSPEVRIDIEEIRNALQADVIKRQVLEGEKAEIARKQIAKVAGRLLRASKVIEESTAEKVVEQQMNEGETSLHTETKEL